MRCMRRVLLIPTILLILLGVVCFLISAGPGPSPTKEPPIVFGTLDDIKTLDIGKMSWANDLRMAMALWDGLTSYDLNRPDGAVLPIPAIAEKWDITPDGKTYTFHLRRDGRWSNGDPVTADDFIFAWKRVLTPATGSDYISLFRVIEGAEAYTTAIEARDAAKKEGKPLPPIPERIAGVQKLDDYTLQVHLNAPCTYFLDICAMPPFFPAHARAMAPFLSDPKDPLQGYDAGWAQPPYLVTNGAFKLTDWKFKQYLLMEPNPYYWDRKNVHCDQLVIKAVSDGRAALMMYQTGALDAMSYAPAEFIDVMLQQQKQGKWADLHYKPIFGTYYYLFNCQRPPFTDKRVRKALAISIDRKAIVDMLNADQTPVGLIVPPNSIPGYASPPEAKTDVDLARSLLAEAGFPQGRGFKSIDLVYNNEAAHAKIAQAIGQMWERNLGVKVNYRGLERGSFGTARQVDHDFDIARGGWYGDYTDPTTWLDLLRTNDGNNDGKFSNPQYDALMDRAAAEPDPAKRFSILRDAEGMLLQQEMPFIPLYQYSDGFIFDAHKIQGIDMNVRTLTELKWIRRVH